MGDAEDPQARDRKPRLADVAQLDPWMPLVWLLAVPFIAVWIHQAGVRTAFAWTTGAGVFASVMVLSYVSASKARARWQQLAADLGLEVARTGETLGGDPLLLRGDVGPFTVSVTEQYGECDTVKVFTLRWVTDPGDSSVFVQEGKSAILLYRGHHIPITAALQQSLFGGPEPFASYASVHGDSITWSLDSSEMKCFVLRVETSLQVARQLAAFRQTECERIQHELDIAEAVRTKERRMLANEIERRMAALVAGLPTHLLGLVPRHIRDLSRGYARSALDQFSLVGLRQLGTSLEEHERRLAALRVRNEEIEDS